MILAWMVWPFILIGAIVGLALRHVLSRWYVPIGWGIAAFPGMFVALLILQYVEPHKPYASNLSEYAFAVRWWDRWRFLRVSRLLSDGWVTHPQLRPTDKDVFMAFLHVCLAASVTVAGFLFALVFLIALVATLSAIGKPYGDGRRP